MLKDLQPTLIITDLRMPTSGLELLGGCAGEIQTTVIVVTAFGTVETAVEAMKMGAYDYVTKPSTSTRWCLVVHRAMERQNSWKRCVLYAPHSTSGYGFESIVVRSKKLLRVLDKRRASHSTIQRCSVQGETGTGKELIAQAIHQNSRRRTKEFVLSLRCDP